VTGTGSATVSYKTPDGTDPKARQGITTDNIAVSLYAALVADPYLLTYYTFELIGSSIYVKRADGRPFAVQGSDGLADKGLNVIKGSVQSFDDLPARAKNGFIVQIVGDDSSEFDRYWVQYDDTDGGTGHGVWKECAAPASLIAVDAATMPHKLVLGAEYLTATVGNLPPTPKVQDGTGKSVSSGVTHTGVIPGPLDTNPWNGTDTPVLLPNVDTQSADHGAYHKWNVAGITGALTDATSNTVAVDYHVDTSVMDPGTRVAVQLQQLNGTSTPPTILAQREYEAGQTVLDETLTGLVSLSGNPIVLQQLYKMGTSPALTFRKGTVTVPADAALTISKPNTRDIVFQPGDSYPENLNVNVILDGTGHTYVVPAGGKTGTTLATALATFLGGVSGFTVTNPSAGIVRVAHSANTTAPGIVVWVSWVDSDAYLPNAGLVSGAQAGRTVQNVTDGSTGTVTSNTTVILSATLTGGKKNAFSPGDTIKVVNTGQVFTFGKETWDSRAAGDETTIPMPSFVKQKIRSLFFYQGRLGVTWGQSVVLSRAGHPTQWFRQSAAHLLADDLIDLTNAHPKVVTFDSAKEWDGGLLLVGNDTQFKLSGQPALTPESVRLDLLAEYPVAPSVDPLILGYPVLLARSRNAAYGHVQLFKKMYYTGAYDAQDLTKDLPTYITGNPVRLVGDPSIGFAALLTDSTPGTLFVYTFDTEQGDTLSGPQLEKQQSAWSRWDFPGATILGMDMLDGVIALVVARSDGIWLESIDVLAPITDKLYKDREGFATPVPYTFQYTPSPFFLRNQQGKPEMRGWLTLHYLDIEYVNTKGLQVVVTPTGKTAWTYTSPAVLASQGTLHVPVGAKNDLVSIVITNPGNGPVCLTGFQWEGSFTSRSKRT
jgi:hypothetical protein